MKNTPARRYIPRPLLIASAVGLVCQTVYSQTVEDLSKTPFANRPLHLEQTATNSGIPGVKPNVLFFVDDSGSMRAAVPGSGGLSRIAVVRGALTNILNTYQDQMRWNILSLWGTENNPPQAGATHPFMTAAQMQPMVNRLREWGWTPTTYRYFQAVRVVRQGIQYRCQKNYVVVLSDGDANRGSDSSTAGLPPFQSWETALFGTFSNPVDNRGDGGVFTGEFWTQRGQYDHSGGGQYFTYINGLTNGIARFSHILAAADLRKQDPNNPNDRDAEGGYWDYNDTDSNPIMRNTLFDKQSIETFAIGFRDGLSTSGRGYLVDAATCENSTSEANKLNKCWFPVSTAADVSNAFDEILRHISNANQGNAASSTYSASTPSSTGSTVAELAATLTLDTGKWSSHLRFADFAGGTLGNTVKDAGYAGRRVLVNDGSGAANGVYWLDSATPATRKADFGINNNQEFTQAFIPWLIRANNVPDSVIVAQGQAIPAAQRTVSEYRVRAATADDPERQMADVLGTPVVALGKVSDTDKKQKYVVTAANDGMVYIFSAASNPTATPAPPPYSLALNYLPAGMQRESALPPSDPAALTVGKTVRVTAEANYGKNDTTNPHVYLNNGGLSWVRTPKTGGRNQQDILLGTMGQGGRGAYALTIAGKKRSSTNANTPAGLDATPASWPTEVPLWETDKSANNALGYTISTGVVGQMSTMTTPDGYPRVDKGVHLYAFIANGHSTGDSAIPYDTSPTLYVYDMMGQEFGHDIDASSPTVSNGNTPGKLIKSLHTGGNAGALSSPTLLDSNKDGMVDFAYAGDTNGDLYRFDLRGDPSTWQAKVHKIYAGNGNQPITAAPAVHRMHKNDDNKFVVIFGTGSDIYQADRASINQQIIMGIHDDVSVSSPVTLASSNTSAILDQTITLEAAGSGQYRFLSTHPFNDTQHRAWRIHLNPGVAPSQDNITSSERVVSKPQVLTRTVFVTTRIYDFKKTATTLPNGADPDHTCYNATTQTETGGTSWQMAIDAVTGAGPKAGDSAANTEGAYFTFSDALAPAVGQGQDRRVLSGVNLGYLSSGGALVNTTASNADHLQTNAHGELGYSGEVVPAFDESPNSTTPGVNVLDRDDPTCIPKGQAYSLLIARGGADAGDASNLASYGITTRFCSDPLSQGRTLIRVDWRQVPL